MKLTEIKFNDEQLKRAVELFAAGFNRQEVISHFIDDEIPPLPSAIAEHGEKDVRHYLSDYLRPTDPSSERFRQKYKQHFLMHNDAIKKNLELHYEQTVVRSYLARASQIKKWRERFEELDHLIDNAIDTFPVGTSELLSTLNTQLNISKRVDDLEEKTNKQLENIATGEKKGEQ